MTEMEDSSLKKSGLKSELQRNRKEHANRVLQEKSIEKAKTRWVLEKEFLSIPIFYNNLPSVSSGPFFKNMELPHSFEDYSTYSLSSLERSYVWKPHFGSDVGIKFDLVDQESVLISDHAVNVTNVIEAKTLGPPNDRVRRGDAIINKNLPWLKRTTYLTNDLFTSKSKFKTADELDAARNALKTNDGKSHYSKEYIDSSFEAVERLTVQSLQKKRSRTMASGDAPTVEWSIPILPDTDLLGQVLSMIQYDVNPATIMSELSASDAAIKTEEAILEGDDQQVMKKRILSSVLANIRSTGGEPETGNSSFSVSLISPTDEDLAQAISLTETKCDAVSPSPLLYEWIRDYRMEIFSQFKETGTFFIRADSTGSTAATYSQLLSKLELKKLNTEESDPHQANVYRRYCDIAAEVGLVEGSSQDAEMPVVAADEDEVIGEEEE